MASVANRFPNPVWYVYGSVAVGEVTNGEELEAPNVEVGAVETGIVISPMVREAKAKANTDTIRSSKCSGRIYVLEQRLRTEESSRTKMSALMRSFTDVPKDVST